MFDVGFSEFFLIFVILLVVVGPKRLPGIARTAGRWIGKARSIMATVRAEVEQELKVDELKRSISEQAPVENLKSFANEFRAMQSEVSAAGNDAKTALDDSTTKVAETVAAAKSSAATKPGSGAESKAKPDNATGKALETKPASIEPGQTEAVAESEILTEPADSSKVSAN